MPDVEMYIENAKAAVAAIDPAQVSEAAAVCCRCAVSGGTIFFCGNGGSAADAQHLAGELVGRFRMERRAIPAIALTANAAVMTAVANDYSYEDVFARQLEALARPGDVLVAITTGGSSPNVVRAVEKARGSSMKVISFTGLGGGAVSDAADVSILASSPETCHAQEALLIIGHAICDAVEKAVASTSQVPVE